MNNLIFCELAYSTGKKSISCQLQNYILFSQQTRKENGLGLMFRLTCRALPVCFFFLMLKRVIAFLFLQIPLTFLTSSYKLSKF